MSAVPQASGAARLAVFQADDRKPRRQRTLVWFEKRQGNLAQGATVALPSDAAAHDVCQLDGKGDSTVLLLGPRGVRALGESALLAPVATIAAHTRDDALPRVKLCFDLFPGEPPALVVPTLTGVTVFKRKGAGYEKHAEVPVEAELRFQGQVLRGAAAAAVQRTAVRIEFPDVTASDFDADGLKDLCFNHAERLECHLQKAGAGFVGSRSVIHHFPSLTEDEQKDTSLRYDSRVIDVNGDGRVDVIMQKQRWSVLDMGTSLAIFIQGKNGGFPAAPTQVIARDGYFGYQEYFDWDGDGRLDLVAPVASLGLTKLAGIFVSRSADVDFVWYRGNGERFEDKAADLNTVSWPIDFKNLQAILGALPVWNVRVKADSARQALFFPGRKGVELRAVGDKGALAAKPLWQQSAVVGGDVQVLDLDGDGLQEIVFAYPRDPERSKTLLLVEP